MAKRNGALQAVDLKLKTAYQTVETAALSLTDATDTLTTLTRRAKRKAVRKKAV